MKQRAFTEVNVCTRAGEKYGEYLILKTLQAISLVPYICSEIACCVDVVVLKLPSDEWLQIYSKQISSISIIITHQ